MNHLPFIPHGVCMMWNQGLILLHVVSDSLIALAYYSIPAALVVVAFRGRQFAVRPILLLFGLFILFCGTGHVLDMITIWKPIYWVKGFWNAGTAIASVGTAFVLIPKVYELVRLPEVNEDLRRDRMQLLEQQSVLRAVLDSVDDVILLVAPTGKILAGNEAAKRNWGLDHTATVSREMLSWMEDARSVQSAPEAARDRVIERSMKEVPGYGRLFLFRDVTERRQLEERRLLLENIIATMKQGFAVVVADSGKLISTNEAFDRMFGFDRQELIGQPFEMLCTGGADVVRQILESATRTGFWEGRLESRRRDNGLLITSARASLYTERGVRYVSIVQIDITAQVEAERERQRIQEKMLESQKLESLGVLAGGIAHDFNNLLAGIIGNAALAASDVPIGSPAHESMEEILKSGERAADLVRQMLAYAGKGKLVIQPVDLSKQVREMDALIRTSIPKHVSLHFGLSESVPMIEADPAQMQQLIMNLVTNAAEAVGEKAGEVRISTGMLQVNADDARNLYSTYDLAPGDYVFLEVSDNGAGMDEATRSQIFDPFFSTKFLGRGLGLPAAMGIVRGHRGGIEVSSQAGTGSRFRAIFPVSVNARSNKVTQIPTQAASGMILFVDDELSLRTLARTILVRDGYRTLIAEGGDTAIELVKKHEGEIDCIVLDLAMPGKGGWETLCDLRAAGYNIPVLISTGYNEAEALQRLKGVPVNGFLQKPYRPEVLLQALRKLLKQQKTEHRAN